MLGRNKTMNYVVGGIAVASVALLAYTLTRPTKGTKRRNKRKSSAKAGGKGSKLEFKFTKKPIDIHLVMETLDGFNALVAGDKKNQKVKLQYGSRLIKINSKRVDGMPFEDIMKTLQSTKTPIVLKFKANEELCAQWTKAEALKEEGNALYKGKEMETAIERVSAAISLHPTNRIYYSNRILMYLSLKSYALALADCQRIRELDPLSTYIKGHYLRGLTLFHLKKYKNAASAFQTVIKLNPSFKKASDRLEECLKELKTETDRIEQRRSSEQESLRQQFLAQQQPKENGNGNVNENANESKQEEEVVAAAVEPEAVKEEDQKIQSVDAAVKVDDDKNSADDVAPESPVVVESVNDGDAAKTESAVNAEESNQSEAQQS